MSRGNRPVCIGMIGAEDDCEVCVWRRECQEMADGIDSANYEWDYLPLGLYFFSLYLLTMRTWVPFLVAADSMPSAIS